MTNSDIVTGCPKKNVCKNNYNLFNYLKVSQHPTWSYLTITFINFTFEVQCVAIKFGQTWTMDKRWLTYKQKIKQIRILWNHTGFFIFVPKNPNNFSVTTPDMAWATSDGPWISINIKGDAKIHQFNLKWRNSIFNGSVYWNHKIFYMNTKYYKFK